MDNVFFDNPPVLQGSERTQLQQLSGYLHTISAKLNEAMVTVVAQEEKEKELKRNAVAGGGTAEKEEGDEQQAYDTLKSLIIKTANIVRKEMDEITTQLREETDAISDQFGELNRTLESTIYATAEGVLQDYHYNETVKDVENNTEYRNQTSQYIFTGMISDGATPEYGIAIGEHVTELDADGTPVLNSANKCATFTMEEMAFWQGEVKMAYFSSGKFYISNGEITKTLQIGNFVWKVLSGGAMALVRT